jgi:hypothetical protein
MMTGVWTSLNRSMSTANWAGFSPNVLEWDNVGSQTIVTKVKDLIPEECKVNWTEVEGWAPPDRTKPKFKIYDGIKQVGQSWPTPVENSFWYPMLMENGDYYGRKLLRPAFQSWFFSILIHLFANRYYERYGEPTPIGRAPFDDDIIVDGKAVKGNTYMSSLLQQLRNRSVVTLPSEKVQGANGSMDYEYDITYLETQMRGADFERYLTRLDEEMSIGLFTPILLLRTADVGSYNLGQGHMQVYLWMLNAMNDDRAQYINKYILSKAADYNFGPNSPRPKIVFRKMGNTDTAMLKEVMVALIKNNKIKPDVNELGEIVGMTLSEIQETVADPTQTPVPSTPDPALTTNAVAREIVARVGPQVEKAFDRGEFGGTWMPDFGFARRMEQALSSTGMHGAAEANANMYRRLEAWASDAVSLGSDQYNGPEDFMRMFSRVLSAEVERASSGT